MASTVVECTVVERECPPCRMPPKTAAAPACPDWAALLTTDLPEAKGQDQEMQAAPDQDQEMEAAASLAWMPLTGSKRRRWQSASWVVAPLQRRRASVKSTRHSMRHSHAAARRSRGVPACSGLPSGTGTRDPTRDCLDAEARLLWVSRPAWCARPMLQLSRFLSPPRPCSPHKRCKLPDISELAHKIGTFLECMGGVGGWKVSTLGK